MKNKIKILIFSLICLAIIPSFVFAFGEVAGPVVFYVPIGGSNTSSWGISNDQPINVQLTAEGNITQFVSLPNSISLEGNNKIYWINLSAKIPVDYNISAGTNITGTFYALAQGQPGQVQINLQLKKNAYIIVEPKMTEQNNNFFTGFFALQSNFWIIGVIAVVVLFALFYFGIKRKEVKN